MNMLPSFGIQYRDGSHTGPTPPERCQYCGRRMRLYETLGYRWKPRFHSDGTPNTIRHAQCSAPLVLRIFGLHDHAIQDEHGDWPWLI